MTHKPTTSDSIRVTPCLQLGQLELALLVHGALTTSTDSQSAHGKGGAEATHTHKQIHTPTHTNAHTDTCTAARRYLKVPL